MSTTSRRFLAGAAEGYVEVILSDTWFEPDTSRPGDGFSQSPADKFRRGGCTNSDAPEGYENSLTTSDVVLHRPHLAQYENDLGTSGEWGGTGSWNLRLRLWDLVSASKGSLSLNSEFVRCELDLLDFVVVQDTTTKRGYRYRGLLNLR